ncbi:brassinosteroid-related acyltransferase 1 [Magnolia sinica]|uniref:brassinosteroid-related acyltransferase 1 n=1 Tax=Magnolia sinica TaxID=86752 RepID=UPI002658B2FD|nr:brassinosteroid-related acyltransferase 1 [Magnolia sinica]
MAPHLLCLSNLDRKCPLLMYLVFFYKKSHPHQNPSLGSLSNSLKLGLERILSVWFPAAGRLAINPTNQKLDLVCNNAGAILVEAVTQVKISELGDLSQYNSFFENLVFKPVFNENFSVMPLVVAQVTTFGCGGYAVGIGISHSLFDGQATFDFLNAWASTIAGRAGGSVQLITPVHERGRLLVGNSQTQPRDRQLTRVVAFDHIYQLIEQAASTPSVDPDRMIGGCNFSELGPTSQEDCVLKTFSVSSAMIECLKRRVGCGRHIGACSSFEVVAAHLWKARTKALGLRNERKVCLQFTVDTRNKMSPPLPRSFSGNAYVLVSTASTAAELDEESIEATIGKIKQAKGVVTDDYVRAYIDALEAPQRALPPIRELTIVSDWTRTPFHTVDFGHGSAAYASPLGSPIPQVAYFMQSPNEAGAIDVRIGLHPQYVHAFYHYFLTMS